MGQNEIQNNSFGQVVLTPIIEVVRNMDVDKPCIDFLPNGSIIIPASCAQDIRNKNFIVMKSFHPGGGYQVHLRQDGILKYSMTVPKEVASRRNFSFKYHLSCQIVTVHNETLPLVLQINDKDGTYSDSSHKIEIPYSAGEWTSTEPIEICLEEGKTYLLCFSREKEEALGLT